MKFAATPTTLERKRSGLLSPFAALGLPDRFAATQSLLCLHVWALLVRLRKEGDDGRQLAQILYESFQDDVELRVHAEGVKVGIYFAGTDALGRRCGAAVPCAALISGHQADY